jgi:hypothetical protein
MAHAWAIYRDEIVFDDPCSLEVPDGIASGIDHSPATPIPPGQTLVLAAREVRLARDFGAARASETRDATLARYDWIFLAETCMHDPSIFAPNKERLRAGSIGLDTAFEPPFRLEGGSNLRAPSCPHGETEVSLLRAASTGSALPAGVRGPSMRSPIHPAP